jgi:catechol 2,3-dioxygenase-like lactoylglutathione lyase family enzyme
MAQALFGQFLEVSLATPDIAASVAFYEQLGFISLTVSDPWPHAYCAMTDGSIALGLHARSEPTLSLCFVRSELISSMRDLETAGFAAEQLQLGDEQFHWLTLRDPSRAHITLVEARTFSPAPPMTVKQACGQFLCVSLPSRRIEDTADFWERAGLVAFQDQEEPYPHCALNGDGVSLALHDPTWLPEPALVFASHNAPTNGEQLQAPEGTILRLLRPAS